MRTLIVLGLLFPAVTAHAAMTAEDFIRQAGSQAVAAMEAGRMAQATDSAPASVRHATDLLERQRALFQVATTVEDAGLAQLARDTLPTLENQLLVADALHDAQELSANIPGR